MVGSSKAPPDLQRLIRWGARLELLTLAWNVVGVIVLAILALRARSIALVGFGLDSLVEIAASTVVLWELRGVGPERERRALGLIATAFIAISAYLVVQSALALVSGSRAHHSPLGIAWTATTALVMFTLAWGKGRAGRAAQREVLIKESRVTYVDGLLASAVLVGLSLNAAVGWWWADPAASYVIVAYAIREATTLTRSLRGHVDPAP